VLDYNPGKKKTIALAGKGITFDSGGISLKLVKTIYEMKHDMAGGAAVLAAVLGAAALKVPYRVVGAIAASENLPSGTALKPGDVVKTYSGKTVEVLNTDAEGRLVLCDALTYLQKHYQPNLLIDVATLTSAMIISLGNDINGAFGTSAKINQQLLKAAGLAGENFHFMPLHPAYKNELNSEVADLRNIGKQRSDAIFAALFLQSFIENNTPWLHLDIAGTEQVAGLNTLFKEVVNAASVKLLVRMTKKLSNNGDH
jgi:leucyl aminopeptidase